MSNSNLNNEQVSLTFDKDNQTSPNLPKQLDKSQIKLFEREGEQRTDEELFHMIMETVMKISLKVDCQQEQLRQIQQTLIQHIETNIFPKPLSKIGEMLLQNGKFIVFFIEIVTRKSRNIFLKLHLYNYFLEQKNIKESRHYFEETYEKLSKKEGIELEVTGEKQNKGKQNRGYSNVAQLGTESNCRGIGSSPPPKKKPRQTVTLKRRSMVKQSRTKKTKSLSKDPIHQNKQLLGSCYHFEIRYNAKEEQKQLRQIRKSARLSHSRKSQNIEEINEDSKEDQEYIDIEDIKQHLEELIVKVNFNKFYQPLTKKDEELYVFLQKKKQAKQKQKNKGARNEQQKNQRSDQEANEESRDVNAQENIQNLSHKTDQDQKGDEEERQDKIQWQIQEVVDPDLNGHGIYALLKLGRNSQKQLGTKYALTSITMNKRAKKREISLDIERAKQLCNNSQLGFIEINSSILEMIEKQKNDE